MTNPVEAEVITAIREVFGEAAAKLDDRSGILVPVDMWLRVATYLCKDRGFNYLGDLTAIDYKDHFEILYRIISLEKNQSLLIRVESTDREHPEAPSVITIWRGADFMEREVYDLMGIDFLGRSPLRRIFLWEGFEGYPLRKDFSL
jgi:NADH-quinone oxidoreductase subunit C